MNRKEYYTMIHTYKRRRAMHRDRVLKLSRKIRVWQRQIDRIDQQNILSDKLADRVNSFTLQDVRNSGRKGNAFIIPRSLYYKYGLENDIKNKYLRACIGDKDMLTPSRVRARFTKSLLTDKTNKGIWEAFKLYLADNPLK